MHQEHSKTPATEVQNNFGTYLAKVSQTDEPVYIERHGKPVAVLVSIRAWEQQANQKKIKKTPWSDMCQKFVDSLEKKGRKHTSAVELVRQLRDEAK